MQRLLAGLLTLLCLGMLTGCTPDDTYTDGTYTAVFKEYDSYGYKEFVTVTVSDGQVTELVYDALNEAGTLRTQDEKYRQNMESVADTYPEKYTTDLINQYMEKRNIDEVDAIAGATWSTDSFKALFNAVLPNMLSGDETAQQVDNVPEK